MADAYGNFSVANSNSCVVDAAAFVSALSQSNKQGKEMLKEKISLDHLLDQKVTVPSWANNWFSETQLDTVLRVCYKTKRHTAFYAVINEFRDGRENEFMHLHSLEFQKNEIFVFYWKSEEDKAMFILKWS